MATDPEDLADSLGGISLGTDNTDISQPPSSKNTKDGPTHKRARKGKTGKASATHTQHKDTNTISSTSQSLSTTGDSPLSTTKAYIPPHLRTRRGKQSTSDSTNTDDLPLRSANNIAGSQLNGNAAWSSLQAPSKYAQAKPHVKPGALPTANKGSHMPSKTQSWSATPWSTAHRTGPAANTRSLRMAIDTSASSGKVFHKLSPPRPEPNAEYIKQANQDAESLPSPRPLLVILDLNGTLLHRTKKGGKDFKTRPYVKDFLDYLFKNHFVMVWSSARSYNVEEICTNLLKEAKDRLVAIWSRENLRLSPQAYNEKVQVYKQLSWVWANNLIQVKNTKGTLWSQADTVLIDDSMEKAASEPYNIVKIEEFEGKAEQMEVDVLGQVVKYLETLRSQKNVSAYVRSSPFVFDESVSFDWKL